MYIAVDQSLYIMFANIYGLFRHEIRKSEAVID